MQITPKFAYKLSNYVIVKVKVTPKSESKLYNYNKVLKCTYINSKLIFLSLLVYYLCIVYIKILPTYVSPCIHVS